jgi:CheY-like chemotaxis protein
MRVMLVEDQVLLREGLAGLFRDACHDVVGSYQDAAGLTGLVAAQQPDIVVLDIRLPPLPARARASGCRVCCPQKTAGPTAIESPDIPVGCSHRAPPALSVNSAVRTMLIMYVRCVSGLGHPNR